MISTHVPVFYGTKGHSTTILLGHGNNNTETVLSIKVNVPGQHGGMIGARNPGELCFK